MKKKAFRAILLGLVFLAFLFGFSYITFKHLEAKKQKVRDFCVKQAISRSKKRPPNVNRDDYEGIVVSMREKYYLECMRRNWDISRVISPASPVSL